MAGTWQKQHRHWSDPPVVQPKHAPRHRPRWLTFPMEPLASSLARFPTEALRGSAALMAMAGEKPAPHVSIADNNATAAC